MSHTDLDQIDLAALRAATGNAEFTEAEDRLLDSYGYRLCSADPLVTGRRARGTRAGQ